MRLTTDTPKNNLEMALNLFYVKDKEVWVRGYGKDGTDISLFDLSRDLTKWNCPYVDLDISDDSFSMMMAEWLWEDVESFEHVLALLYQAAWVCAELREHLKQFEDAIQTPEKAAWAKKTIEMAFSDDTSEVERLRELYKADKDGRVVILPCKVGSIVYRVFTIDGKAPVMLETRIKTLGQAADVAQLLGKRNKVINVFLTREEAEKAMKGETEK